MGLELKPHKTATLYPTQVFYLFWLKYLHLRCTLAQSVGLYIMCTFQRILCNWFQYGDYLANIYLLKVNNGTLKKGLKGVNDVVVMSLMLTFNIFYTILPFTPYCSTLTVIYVNVLYIYISIYIYIYQYIIYLCNIYICHIYICIYIYIYILYIYISYINYIFKNVFS